MEETIFPLPAVAGLLTEGYIEARLHTDGEDGVPQYDRSRELQEEMAGSKANPIYLIVDPQTGATLDRFEGADLTGTSFEAFLREALERGPR